MSLVVVKTSAVTIYQNRTSPATSVNDQTADSNNHLLSQFQATTSEFITTNPILNDLTNHIIRTNIIVGAGSDLIRGNEERRDSTSSRVEENLSKITTTTAADNMRAKLQQLLQRENDNDDEEKQQLQQDLQQQQQQHLYQEAQHAMLTGENAYLLERIDGVGGGGAGVGVGSSGSVHEQPIYGTWSAKARRPQAPLLAATATTTTTTTASATAHLQPSSSIQTLMTEVDENLYGRFNAKPQKQQQQQHLNHHYERLPKRSSTMTPVRRELHDQIPRPPRLTSRQPSVALRRQYSDTPLSMGVYRDESRPKPFHYPFDGPLPEEFKKIQQSERAIAPGLDSDPQVHNIQDILQKLNLGGAAAASKMPPLMMMPTGLHISGSFKNLKSSGIGNFFRGKRNKKQIQMQFPMPIPMQMMPNPYQTTMIMPQPYQQRIAMEQFYPFKARSPGEINLLAMQQQQQQQQQKFKNPHSKGKKQKKKQKDKKNSSSNLMLQQYPFVTAAPEMIFPSMYSPYMSINVTQAPPLQMSKRVPFKVNLDIFPVMPPSKNHKPPSSYAVDEARLVSTMRAPTVLRNPFMEYLTTPVTPSVAALNFYNPYNQKQPLYNPIRFPSGVQNPSVNMAQSNNLQMVYPEQMQKYLQQQQQQQQQNLFNNFLNTQGHQTPFLPIDCEQPIPSASSSQTSMGNTKTNPIMVHLNVFPKQKPTTPLSTNPFYSNVPQIQRNTIQEENESPQSPIEPRHQGRSLNDTLHTKIERSDSSDTIQHIQPLRAEDDLVDFDHPIVAENSDDNNELPQPLALQGTKTNITSKSSSSSFYYESRPNTTISLTGDNNNLNSNYNGNTNSNNMEQMVSEAKTASLFRFPVEDLIQFQVNDAM